MSLYVVVVSRKCFAISQDDFGVPERLLLHSANVSEFPESLSLGSGKVSGRIVNNF